MWQADVIVAIYRVGRVQATALMSQRAGLECGEQRKFLIAFEMR